MPLDMDMSSISSVVSREFPYVQAHTQNSLKTKFSYTKMTTISFGKKNIMI